MKSAAVIAVIATLCLMAGWDMLAALTGQLGQASWCDAYRDLNRQSGGLLGLATIALVIHLLFYFAFPAAWGGPQ